MLYHRNSSMVPTKRPTFPTQARARPASAQPISTRSYTPTSETAAATATRAGITTRHTTSRRRPYRARGLPPPWDDNSSTATGCSSGSGCGAGGGGCRSAGRRRDRAANELTARRARRASSTVPKSLDFAGGLREYDGGKAEWDDEFCISFGPRSLADRRAAAAKATAAANAASEVRRGGRQRRCHERSTGCVVTCVRKSAWVVAGRWLRTE